MRAHSSLLESLTVEKAHENPVNGEITRLILASANLKECSLFQAHPSENLLMALASRRSLRSFKFFEPADSRFVPYFETNIARNTDFFSRYEAAILSLLCSNELESFHHNGWQLTTDVLHAIALCQSQIKDLALGFSGYSESSEGGYGALAGVGFALLERELITTLKATRQLKTLMLRQDWTSCAHPEEPNARKYFVTDKTLETLAESCSDLTRLELFNCTNITSEGITFLVLDCFNSLEQLFLVQEWYAPLRQPTSYDAIDDKALKTLSYWCDKLKDFAISSRSITNIGVAHLLACPKLESLNLDGCRLLTPDCLQTLRTSLPPNLDYINLQHTFVNSPTVIKDIETLLLELLPRLLAKFKLDLDIGTYFIERKNEKNSLFFKCC